MKTVYVCEECGKRYDSEKEACACEVKHKQDAERVEKLAKEKDERNAHIEEMILSFIEDYHEYPTIIRNYRFGWFF